MTAPGMAVNRKTRESKPNELTGPSLPNKIPKSCRRDVGQAAIRQSVEMDTSLGEPSRVSGRLRHAVDPRFNRPLTRLGSP
jgi:hypothetical protein